MAEIVIRADFDPKGEWYPLIGEFVSRLIRGGHKPILRPTRKTKVPDVYLPFCVDGYRKHDHEIIIGALDQMPTRGKKTIYFTRWPFEGIRKGSMASEILDQVKILIVPSKWDAGQFSKRNPKQIILVVLFGVNYGIYYGTPNRPKDFTIGYFDDHNAALVGNVLRHAFPRGTPCRVVRFLECADLCFTGRFYRSINVLLDLDCASNGLRTINAMACGTPVIAPLCGPRTEYFTMENGYPVSLKRGALPIEQVAHQVRRAYLDQKECARICCFVHKTSLEWQQAFKEFESVLKYAVII